FEYAALQERRLRVTTRKLLYTAVASRSKKGARKLRLEPELRDQRPSSPVRKELGLRRFATEPPNFPPLFKRQRLVHAQRQFLLEQLLRYLVRRNCVGPLHLYPDSVAGARSTVTHTTEPGLARYTLSAHPSLAVTQVRLTVRSRRRRIEWSPEP
ncbi:unnamed protein product, partial [Scytosiphon promiscuus]